MSTMQTQAPMPEHPQRGPPSRPLHAYSVPSRRYSSNPFSNTDSTKSLTSHLSPHEPSAQAYQAQNQSDVGQAGEFPQAAQEAVTRPRPVGARWFFIVVTILVNTFVYAIDNTIVAIIQPNIVEQFGNLADLPWVSVGFVMAGTATALPISALFGVFDSKWLYLIFTVTFTAASGLCGGAPSMAALIVGRIFAGIGGNGMYLGALTLLSVLTEPVQTPEYIGYLGLSWGVGTVIGPLIGGALGESAAGWRWAFYMNLVIGAVSIPALLILTPSFRPRPMDLSVRQALDDIDWTGVALSLPFFVLIIMAISFGGTQFPWDGAAIASLFWASAFLLFLFWAQQYTLLRTNMNSRLFPIHFFARKDLLLMFIIQASAGGLVVVPLYLMALFYPFAQHDTALEAGIKLLPLVVFLVTAIVLNGRLMSMWGHHQYWIVAGSLLVLVSGVFFVIYGLQVVLGIGTGAFSQSGFAIAQALVEPFEIQNAISFMLIAQLGGTSLGLSISEAIFQNLSVPRVAAALGSGYSADDVVRIVTQIDPGLLESLSPELKTAVQDIVISAIVNGLSLIYAGGAVCLLCGVFLTPNRHLLGRKAEGTQAVEAIDSATRMTEMRPI